MAKSGDPPHFDVHPSVVYQLGESLVSDSIQALIELVKNSYDADAKYAKVVIDTHGAIEVPGSLYTSAGGRITIEDDGIGMTEEAVREGWLIISNRRKRALKEAKQTTPGGRTPLGDKGLGRLGVQRLGDGLDVFTKTKTTDALHFGFSWLDFATAPTLQAVDVHLGASAIPKKPGTLLVVSNLREPELWRGQDAVSRLIHDLSRMISPFKAIRDFVVFVEVDGKPLQLMEVSDQVRAIAPIAYTVKFDGNQISYHGRARLGFFRPDSDKEAEEFALIVEADHGAQLFQFLSGRPEATQYKLTKSASKKWYVEFELIREFSDFDKLERDPGDPSRPANPGAFSGEIDSFDFGRAAFQSQSVFDALSEYRNHVKQLSGIGVYRDGFAIRVDRDWLKLGAGWTSARSYYGLKPDNTLGYIAISARENMCLEEKTDREGFKDNAHYRNFNALLEGFRTFANDVQRFFGRSWVEFRKERLEQLSRVDTRKSIEDLSRSIRSTVEAAADQQTNVAQFAARMQTGVSKSVSVLGRLAKAEQMTPAMQQQARDTVASLNEIVGDAKQIMEGVNSYLEQLQNLRGVGQLLEDRAASLRRQVDDMYEAVALGLTAEAIVHEVFQITENLSTRTKRLKDKLDGHPETKSVNNYLEHVQAATSALRKQVSFLSPALRYVREQKEEIPVVQFVRELTEFYREQMEKSHITISAVERSSEPFTVRMNRGKLTQVFVNLFLNSEYWLREDIRQGRLTRGDIVLEVERPFIRISDNGRGIDPSVEAMLFEPFVTAKARGVGRGLGLFIVKQMLDADGCHIGVLPQRNRSRRLHSFQIDLRGALHE